MKILKFSAPDMNKLLALVKKELGDEAVVISTADLPDGNIELIAAVENDDISFDDKDEIEIAPAKYQDTFVREALAFHELTVSATSKILAHCRQIAQKENLDNDAIVIEKVCEDIFRYYQLLGKSNTVKMFMGIQGSGKSTAVAKVAMVAKMNGTPTTIISTDTVRAGANNQLKAFADILGSEFVVVRKPENLQDKVLAATSKGRMVLIDTPGINPFIADDVKKLSRISEALSCQKILILDAGRNAYDAVEAADIFKALGADSLLPAKLDLTRRLGAVLSVAAESNLALGYASISSGIAKSLAKVTAKSLAGLVIR